MTTDDMLLSTVAATLSKTKFLCPLRTLCARKVAECLFDYAEEGMDNLCSLPAVQRAEVYKELVRVASGDARVDPLVKQKWRLLSSSEKLRVALLFVDKDLQTFSCSLLGGADLTGDETSTAEDDDGDRRQYLLEKLSRMSQKLLVYDDERPAPSEIILERQVLQISKMKNLVKLEIKMLPLKDDDLKQISINLQKLQFLNVQLQFEDITESGLQNLVQLTNLKWLILHHESIYGIKDEERAKVANARVNLCHRLMPHLKAVGFKCDFEFKTIKCPSSPPVTHEFEDFKEPVSFGLEHLLTPGALEIPDTVLLPDVSHVMAYVTIPEANFSRFHKLSCLYFFMACFTHLEQILAQVGHQLSQLSIYLCIDTVDVVHVLQTCPNLTHLHLQSMTIRDNLDTLEHNVPIAVRCLQTFELVSALSKNVESRGLLHLLMTSCPDLRSVSFYCVRVSAAEFDRTCEALQKRSTPVLVTKVSLQKSVNKSDSVQRSAYFRFVLSMLAYCPNLDTLPMHEPTVKQKLLKLKRLLLKLGRLSVLNP